MLGRTYWRKDGNGIHCAIRLLQGGKIEYRYFRKEGRGWNLRTKYTVIAEEIDL